MRYRRPEVTRQAATPIVPPTATQRGISRGLLQAMAQHSPVGEALVDRDGIFRHVNPAYGAIHGWRPDELLGRPFTMLLPSLQREAALALHRQFLDGPVDLEREVDVVRRDGTVRKVMARSVCVPGDDGQPCRAVYEIDITERRGQERAAPLPPTFAQTVLDGLAEHICVIDEHGTVVVVNRAWREFATANAGAGATAALHEGASYLAVCDAAARTGRADGAEAAEFLARLRELLAGQLQRFELEYACHSSAQQRWFVVRVSRLQGSEPPRFVVAHLDVTALKQAQATLHLQASTDELTGVASRRHFLHALDVEFERVRRHPGLQSSVLILDVDHFKSVNDSRGHAAGDAVLRHITLLVGTQTRPIDVLGRMGGEEFALLLPDTGAEQALALAQRLGQGVAERPLPWAQHRIGVTVSIGVSLLDAADASAHAALARADAALYDAKNGGRNTVRFRAPSAAAADP